MCFVRSARQKKKLYRLDFQHAARCAAGTQCSPQLSIPEPAGYLFLTPPSQVDAHPR